MITRTKELDSYINKGVKYIVDNNLLPGQSVFIGNKFAGDYILNLTDYDRSSSEETRKILIKQTPYKRKLFGNGFETEFYSVRSVFNTEFGTIKQVLVLNITGDDLVWINV